jgi:hypothetical protein
VDVLENNLRSEGAIFLSSAICIGPLLFSIFNPQSSPRFILSRRSSGKGGSPSIPAKIAA